MLLLFFFCFSLCFSLLTVFNLEIRPSITIKNREIWQTNITNTFISNLVPHVFGRLYFFTGHVHKYMRTPQNGTFRHMITLSNNQDVK
ncbi:hypothetical protein BDA96_01G282300 [Sorghum bicolor]|uniref:Uncharacterized protein n=2 Tax=Sorghum bicolor TaxID=4558 RepID=A0A921UYR0_SORBI|nr:hypothetical protein BDA96_01G282300 [Sorghum bicolor]OQU91941.1 hypothetical protein SORBI_3001G262301 [Sorghum bicolor]